MRLQSAGSQHWLLFVITSLISTTQSRLYMVHELLLGTHSMSWCCAGFYNLGAAVCCG